MNTWKVTRSKSLPFDFGCKGSKDRESTRQMALNWMDVFVEEKPRADRGQGVNAVQRLKLISTGKKPPSHPPFHRILTHAEVLLGQSSSSSRGGNLATPKLTAKSMVTFCFLQQVQVVHPKERLTCGNCCFSSRVSWHIPLSRRAWILNHFRIRTDSEFL